MPQRNGQNPTRAVKFFGQAGNKFNDGSSMHAKNQSGSGVCQACGAEVPPKPGFRFSALNCPKCGVSMSKKEA